MRKEKTFEEPPQTRSGEDPLEKVYFFSLAGKAEDPHEKDYFFSLAGNLSIA